MLTFFLEHRSIPEVNKICVQLELLKNRIQTGDYNNPDKEYDECKNLFEVIKQQAVENDNEQLANAQAVFRNYFRLFCHLSQYFGMLDRQEYKLSWNMLQDCLDDIKFVGKFLAIEARMELPDLAELLEKYELLYPYNVFVSSEYIISKSHCSICGKSMQSLACPHIKGNLYYGDIAVEIIDDIQEFQAACLVSHPEDKRCIIELSDDNRTEKEKFEKLDQFLSLKLPHLQMFTIKTVMEMRERTDVIKVGRNAPCSCGSGLKFKKCCGKNLYYQHKRNIVSPQDMVSFV